MIGDVLLESRARRRRAADARRLREPRRPHVPRRGRRAARPRRRRLRQRRRERLRGLPRRPRDRHVPPRPAAAAEPVARRLAARAGARAPDGRRGAELEPLDDELEREAHAVSAQRARARAAAASRGLGRPERAEVDDRVARPPAAQEALDRRVQDDLVELVDARRAGGRGRPRPATSPLERAAAEVAREDDVHDVLRREARAGRDRVDDRDRALDGSSSSMPTSSRSSRCSASTRLSPELTPPPGSSQYSLPGFSCRQSRIRSSPAQDRRDADPRLAHQRSTSRSRARRARCSGSSSTSTSSTSGTGEHDELRDPHPRLDDERARAGRCSAGRRAARRGSRSRRAPASSRS